MNDDKIKDALDEIFNEDFDKYSKKKMKINLVILYLTFRK